jgi:tetratricopeptide (TPR) repeat protein
MALVGSLADRHDFGRAPLPTRTQVAERLRVLSSATQRRIGAALAPRSADPELSPGVLSREAARCNGLGLALRRAGHARQAATLHQAARLIFAEAGDSRSAALTANVLGVALAEAGRQDAALEQFAQARTLLRALGERQWEGKVLANIGLAKHRVGEDDQAVDFLQSALELLTPETEAYGRVERRLKQAG